MKNETMNMQVRLPVIFRRTGTVRLRIGIDRVTGRLAVPTEELPPEYLESLLPVESYVELRNRLANVRTLQELVDFFNAAGYLVVDSNAGTFETTWQRHHLTRPLVRFWRGVRTALITLLTIPGGVFELQSVGEDVDNGPRWDANQGAVYYYFGEFYTAPRTVDGEEVIYLWGDDPLGVIIYTIKAEKPTSHRCEYRRCGKVFPVVRRYSYEKKYCDDDCKAKEIKRRKRKATFDTAMRWALIAQDRWARLSQKKKDRWRRLRSRSQFIALEAAKIAKSEKGQFPFTGNWVTTHLKERQDQR